MNYIKQMNAFLSASGDLPANAIVLYLRLFEVFNEAGWPEDYPLSNRELSIKANIPCLNTLYAARDRLIKKGLVRYNVFSSKKIGRYRLVDLTGEDKTKRNARRKTDIDSDINNISENISDCGTDIKTDMSGISENISEVISEVISENISDSEFLPIRDKTINLNNKLKTKTTTTTTCAREDFDGSKILPPMDAPTVDDVKNFAEAQGLAHVDTDYFWRYYAAGGWRDEGGNPFNWRQKLLMWDKRDAERKVLNASNKPSNRASPPVGHWRPEYGKPKEYFDATIDTADDEADDCSQSGGA